MSEIVTTENGGQVTFVQGQAVEQTVGTDSPEGAHGDELAAAKAAVKKALQEEGKKAAAEVKESRAKDPMVRARDEGGKFASKAAKEEPEEDAEEAPTASRSAVKKALSGETSRQERAADPEAGESEGGNLKRALAERKELAKFKAEAQAELQRMQQETRQFYQQLQQEKAQLAQEKQRLEMLRKDPVKAIKENGWNPEEFILDLAEDGTPQGQLRRQQRELQHQLQEMQTWKQQQAEERQRAQQEYEQRQRVNYRQTVEKQFLGTVFESKAQDGAEKYQHLATMYKGHERGLLAEADMIAEEYRAATGQEASFEDIAEYLEDRAAKWYRSISGRASNVPQGAQEAPPVTRVSQPNPGSSGKRTLSPNSGGERRTLGNTLKDLEGDERLEAAREAVKAALAAAGD